jgi:hypothetical protein
LLITAVNKHLEQIPLRAIGFGDDNAAYPRIGRAKQFGAAGEKFGPNSLNDVPFATIRTQDTLSQLRI